MNNRKLARFSGLFCIFGAFVAFIWGILNTFYPNSANTVRLDNFEVLIPWLHRVENACYGILVYPALFAGFLGFYLIGAVGRGITGKILITLAALGGISASLASLTEAFVLQSETADKMRDIGFEMILLLICPILFTAAALMTAEVKAWKRFAPLVTLGMFILFTLPAAMLNMRYLPLSVGLALLSWIILGLASYTEKDTELLSE